MTCPIGNKKRVFYVKTQSAFGSGATIAATDALQVIDVQFSVNAEGTIDRSDVWSAFGAGGESITGSLAWQFTVTTELYAPPTNGSTSGWRMLPLFRGTPSRIVQAADPSGTNDLVQIFPRSSGCYGEDVFPFTVEIHEVNGAIYRAEDCLATYTLSAEPGQRILMEWTISGTYVDPIDNPNTLTPVYAAAHPLIYKSSVLDMSYIDPVSEEQEDLDLPNCPAFTFDPGMTETQIPTACTPEAAPLVFVGHEPPAILTFSGVISEKPSVQPVFRLSRLNVDLDVSFKVADIVQSPGADFQIVLPKARLAVPELTEVESYMGVDLTLNATATNGDDQYTLVFGEVISGT